MDGGRFRNAWEGIVLVESVCAMIRVTHNVLGDISMTTALAGREKLMDETVYGNR